MNPPLRTEADRQAIIAGLRDGTLDCIGTDHAPHTTDEKDREFDYAPNGIIGLETALPVCLEVLVRQNKFKLAQVDRPDDAPRRRRAQAARRHARRRAPPPMSASSIPTRSGPTSREGGFSKSRNSPWHGQTLTGRVKTTIVDGKIVYANGKII